MEGWIQEVLARAIAEQPLVGVYLMIDRRMFYANQRTLDMFGLTAEMISSFPITDMVTPESRPQMEAMVRERELSSSFTMRYVTRGQHTNGTTFDLEVYGAAFDTERGRVVAGNFLDVTERVAAERATREAAASFRSLIEVNPDPVVVHVDGRIVFANAATARVVGASSAEALVGKPLWSRASTGQMEAVTARLAQLSAGSSVPTMEQTYRRFDDGSEVTLEVTGVPVVFEGQRAALATARDITARKAAERERARLIDTLEFERKRLTSLLEDAPAFIAILRGPTKVFEFINRAYSKVVRRSADEVLGKPLLEALSGIDAQGYSDMIDRVMATGEPYAIDYAEVRFDDAETLIIRFVCEPITEADGTTNGVFVLGFDTTDLHRATEAQAEGQRRYRQLFQAHPVPSLSWVRTDGEFRLGDLNDAARTFFGPNAGEMRGKRPGEVFEGSTDAALVRALADNVRVQAEVVRKVQSTGENRSLNVTLVPVASDTVLGHVEDVTERRALEERLRHSQKMEAIGVLAGGVAHDFNNLITVVRAACEFLEPVLAAGTEARGDLDQITKACETAAHLTRQLLAFGRKQVLKLEPVDVSDVVTNLTPILARLLPADVRILRTLHARGRVKADVTQLEQVLLNLAANARDAMPSGGTFALTTREITLDDAQATTRNCRPGPHVMLQARDSGAGMDEATRARIFEPFFTTKELGHGTGLGLATVYGIVEQLGGCISVESALGKGTTFELLLPRHEGEAPAKKASEARSLPSGKTEVILLVDDDDAIRLACKRTLEREGYVVHSACDGQDALDVAAEIEGPIDLVLTDVVMPRMGARELADKLRLARPKQKFVFMSGYTDDAIVRRGVAENETKLLAKPFTPTSLLGVIRESLKG